MACGVPGGGSGGAVCSVGNRRGGGVEAGGEGGRQSELAISGMRNRVLLLLQCYFSSCIDFAFHPIVFAM